MNCECECRSSLNRMKDLTVRLGLSRSFIYRMISEGRFPAPVVISGNIVAWHEHEVLAWIASRPKWRVNSATLEVGV